MAHTRNGTNIAKRMRSLGSILLILAAGVIAAGMGLQWRLGNISSDPEVVARIGTERHLVKSIEKAAVDLLNRNDEKKTGEQLEEMYQAFDEWISNHHKLAALVEEPRIHGKIIDTLNIWILPHYQVTVDAFKEVFRLARQEKTISLSRLKPLVKEAERAASVYLFYLDALDLQLAEATRKEIVRLQVIEGSLIIGAGLLLLMVLLWLFFPGAKKLARYQRRVDEMLDELQEKNTLLSELFFKVERKAEYITDCLNTLAHEIRNPLAVIMTAAEVQDRFLTEGKRTDEDLLRKIRRTVGQIRDNGQRAQEILVEFLEMTRIEGGLDKLNIERIELRTFLSRILDEMHPKAERKGLEFLVEISEKCPVEVFLDSIKLERVIANLLSNAIKYTDAGSVALRVTPSREIDSKQKMIEIIVQDTGIGIPENSLGSIFEPFTTPNRREGSIGLGLTITRRLIDALQGSIAVESTPHQGSKFTVRLPQDLRLANPGGANRPGRVSQEAETSQVEAAQALKANEKVKGLRVLLIEDGKELRELTTQFLNSAGITVQAMGAAEEALGRLDQVDESIDLVLMDIGLPGMDGIAAIRVLRSRGLDVPAVALTSYASRYSRSKCLQAGFTDFLQKPVTPAALSECVIRHASKTNPDPAQEIAI